MDDFRKFLKQGLTTKGGSISPSLVSKCARDVSRHCLETGQVAPANQLIQAALKLKGINADRLAKWLSHAIPHDFHPETKRFGKKKKSQGASRSAEKFLINNPDFYKWVAADDITRENINRVENRPKHVKALRASATEILKGDYMSLTSSEVSAIEKVISDLRSMVYAVRLLNDSTERSSVKAQFVSGGLPSLGKKKN